MIEKLEQDRWEAGDYVVALVDEPPPGFRNIELVSGRVVELVQGDSAFGAFGVRHAALEPVNGDTVLDELGERVRRTVHTVLCVSDPYAIAGVMRGFERRADLVAGIATSTIAGVELCEKLAGIPALNLLDPAAKPALEHRLIDRLGL